jgi:oligopeptidase B
MLEPMRGMREILFGEIKSRIKEDDQSAPYRRGDYFYYYRYVEGGEYPIYARKKGSLDADEEIMLDVNKLAGDAEYFAVRSFKVSPGRTQFQGQPG